MDEPGRDDLRRRPAVDALAAESDLARLRPDEARKRLVERRLADAVGAEHGDDSARRDVEIDAAQDGEIAIAGDEAAHGKQRLRH